MLLELKGVKKMHNDSDPFKGYRGEALELLKKYGVKVWSRIEVNTDSGNIPGIILPRNESEDEKHLVLKLNNGYNTGINVKRIKKIIEKGHREANYKIPEKKFPYNKSLPNITLLGTGGTIASRLDYRTGAVIPAFSPGELYGAVPELADIANLKTKKLFGVFSEDMEASHWIALAKAIGEEIKNGVDGIVIGHGTDTMHHTGSILSFMVQNPPVPIVLVGSQRSSDRPSSDAALNLINATRAAAYGDIAEILVCMFGPTSDEYDLLHRGTRVRKMHSSYRSTFRTIGETPLAMVYKDRFKYLVDDFKKRRKDRNVTIDTAFNDRVSIVYYYPNMKGDIIDSLVDSGYRGIVIAGTGLGHVNRKVNPSIKRAIKKGVTVVMTVQTLWGYVQMYVYDTGRDLLDLGIIPCQNMLPETAFTKLGWVLGHTDVPDVIREMMQKSYSHETTDREPHNGYLILQGGIPETESFISHIRK